MSSNSFNIVFGGSKTATLSNVLSDSLRAFEGLTLAIRSRSESLGILLSRLAETVRELQEALERIEHDMASKGGKVRRELRDPAEEAVSISNQKPLLDPLLEAEIERNKTLERGPMYNMVLKYMPYLKQYESGILSKSDTSSGNIASRLSVQSVVIVLVFTSCL